MIELTKLNDQKFVLNCDLIKMMESTPDTVITLTTGEKMLVKNPVSEVIFLTVQFRKKLYQEPIVIENKST